MDKTWKSLILFILGIVGFSCYGQDVGTTTVNNEKSGLHMTKAGFAQLVTECVQKMRQNEVQKNQDYVTLVRVYNTITGFSKPDDSSINSEFIELFVPAQMGKAIKALDATLTKGMCYYSSKYDLFIGGPPHQNSMFQIE